MERSQSLTVPALSAGPVYWISRCWIWAQFPEQGCFLNKHKTMAEKCESFACAYSPERTPLQQTCGSRSEMHLSMLSIQTGLCSTPFLGACFWVNSLTFLSLTFIMVPALQKKRVKYYMKSDPWGARPTRSACQQSSHFPPCGTLAVNDSSWPGSHENVDRSTVL